MTIRRRRRSDDEEGSHDRWVVSYADFITLLFAFFTTMYAISHVDQGKLERFTGSMKNAFQQRGQDAVSSSVIEGIKAVNYPDIGLEEDLKSVLGKFEISDAVVITREPRGVVLSLGDRILFESGGAELKREAYPLFTAAAAMIKKYNRQVVVEGHTDNLPLRDARYASNLELSVMRAARAYEHLISQEAADPALLSVAGYGDYRPIASNDTPEGRARNRRIDLLFIMKKEAP